MTATLSQQTMPVKDIGAAARKRRRRAPTGGASDDCFACIRKNLKCDRRRPYCSQCLDVGTECSGYKTQLTWGVGVASRGKLRGLSLPIAKAPPVTREAKKSSPSRSRASSTTPVNSMSWHEHDSHSRPHHGPIDIPSVMPHLSMAGSAPTTPYTTSGYEYLSLSQPDSMVSMPPASWSGVSYSSDLMHAHVSPKYSSKFSLPLITDGLSSVDSVSDVDYLSPLSQPYSRDELPFSSSGSHKAQMLYDAYSHPSSMSQSPPSGLLLDHSRASTSCSGVVYTPPDSTSSLGSHLDPFDAHLGNKFMRECESLSASGAQAYGINPTAVSPFWTPYDESVDEVAVPTWTPWQGRWQPCCSPVPLRLDAEVMARMPLFMDYYSKTMAPSMVYIDGPHNPFGHCMLELASNSRSLQHAICALAACNVRMKRELSLGQNTQELRQRLMAKKLASDSLCDLQQPDDTALAEEFQHRNMAVALLNEQLDDAAKATHDSVLATILILCHYRMAESGVAKFHTQFAGVKKILAVKDCQGQSHSSAWMAALFTYLDGISATINDREAQLAGHPGCRVLPAGSENLVGCERELFCIISSLGRLNLLSQQRPVRDMAAPPWQNSECRHGTAASPLGQSRGGSGMHTSEACQVSGHRFDGNGFGTLLDDDEMIASAMRASSAVDDWRCLFWQEWRDTRLALQSWHFDAVAVAATLPGSPSPALVRGLGHLSEAFRYAALLYTERLARPAMLSSHVGLQKLVSQVVYYVTSIDAGSAAEKFLLWPLFVAGSECVNELEQNILRNKCREIMSRSGYMNTLSALDVLEKLWAGDLSKDCKESGCRGPFRWARCFGGPGADAEWIMF
ncbi:hypothetical protein CDD81_5993 [Ophiocordyceps australis]|uniref:Zn(2)-C6 fungal-type domain-containing protein n=1 Tax=Ophiocordyceps australis TaxID=1399860 RepID=A0A2C5Y812_9HYPO|nr:hypothetical protein CDD81_5993 [Ophiocordyceps australis]